MGCPKHLYNPDQEPTPFIGLWKKEAQKESETQFYEILGEKRGQQKKCVNYYPFGLTFNGYNQSPKNNYLYNQGFGEKTFQGKDGTMFKVERQPELGIDLTKFRAYDPALGRWWQIDPAADMVGQESWTPYHYAFNNPVLYNDPYGDCPECFDLSNIGKGFREAGSRVSRRARAAGDAISKGANSLRTSMARGASNIGQGFSQLGSTAKANAKKRLNQLRSFLKENVDGAFSGNEPDTRGTGDGTSFGGFEFVKTSGPTGSQGVQGNPEGQMDVTDIASVKSPGSLGTTGSGAPGGIQAGAEFIKDVGGTVNQIIDIAQSYGASESDSTVMEFYNDFDENGVPQDTIKKVVHKKYLTGDREIE